MSLAPQKFSGTLNLQAPEGITLLESDLTRITSVFSAAVPRRTTTDAQPCPRRASNWRLAIGITMFSEELISTIRVNNIVLFFLYGLDLYEDIDE